MKLFPKFAWQEFVLTCYCLWNFMFPWQPHLTSNFGLFCFVIKVFHFEVTLNFSFCDSVLPLLFAYRWVNFDGFLSFGEIRNRRWQIQDGSCFESCVMSSFHFTEIKDWINPKPTKMTLMLFSWGGWGANQPSPGLWRPKKACLNRAKNIKDD